jgi:transcriptional regulator with XRE-family HTH domain
MRLPEVDPTGMRCSMPASQEPAALRRRAGRELRRLRISAGRTESDVAQELSLSVSDIVQFEGGRLAPSEAGLLTLLRMYGVTDADATEISGWVEASRADRWEAFTDATNGETLAYFAYEAGASVIRWYETTWVPGLLQTADYTRALLKDAYGYSAGMIDAGVESRRERQAVLETDDGPQTLFLVEEAVLRRPVGGDATFGDQLRHLAELAEKPNVSIRVVPFGAGAHPHVFAPFIVLEPADAGEPDMLYLEQRMTATLSNDVGDVADHLDRFDALHGIADDELLGRIVGEA